MSFPRPLLAVLFATVLAASSAPAAHAAGACTAEKFSGNRVFAACADLPRLGASLHWSYDAASSSLSVAFLAAPPSSDGWVAWGLNPKGQGMDGTQALVAVPKGGGYEVRTYSISGTALGNPGPIAYQTSGLAAEAGTGGDGRVRIFGTLKLQNGTGAEVNQVWQVGPYANGNPQMHDMKGDNMNSKGTLNLLTGATAGASGGSILRKKNVSSSPPLSVCVKPFVHFLSCAGAKF